MGKSNPKEAAADMAKALAGIFRQYSRDTRHKAWRAITSERGEKEVKKLLLNPSRPVNTFKNLSFREWLDIQD